MLDARKAAILRRVVAEHIVSGEPVGSQQVVKDEAIDVSPATVRADMAALERDGYLTHPHTSAGRVPTDLGYRYFVDHLDSNEVLDPISAERVAEFFTRAHRELDSMLRDTSRLLSALTDYAAVVVGPAHEDLLVRSVLVTRLAPAVAMVVAVLSNGVVEKQVFDLDEETTDEEIERANRELRQQCTGQVFSRLSVTPGSGAPKVDQIVACCLEAFTKDHSDLIEPADVYIGGTSTMARQFSAVDTVQEILSILEQSLVVVTLLSEVVAKGNSVSIGTENEVESLAECSLVVAPYRVDDEVVGTIGVLGPTRMNYPQALSAVAAVSKHLGDQLAGN